MIKGKDIRRERRIMCVWERHGERKKGVFEVTVRDRGEIGEGGEDLVMINTGKVIEVTSFWNLGDLVDFGILDVYRVNNGFFYSLIWRKGWKFEVQHFIVWCNIGYKWFV